MAHSLSPDRALLRLRQLEREERHAVALGDVESLCRVAALLPGTVAAIDGQALMRHPDGAAIVASARASHSAAEEMLVDRMREIRRELDGRMAGRRAASGYAGRRAMNARLNGEG